MRKTLILILVVVVLIVIALVVAQRRPRTCAASAAPTSFQGVKRDDTNKPVAKVNMILSAESKLLSYSIVLKNLKDEIDSVHFVSNGREIFQASGPRNPQQEGGEVIVHGLWREKSRVPITAANISDLTEGRMSAIVKFKDTHLEPFVVEMRPKM
jgi:hypothetical protein